MTIKACIAHIRSISAELEVNNSIAIEQHFPGGEADFYIANLAIERKAFILSQDSDFFITSHGSRGYIPLDSVHFVKKEPKAVQGNRLEDDGDDWGQVSNSRRNRRTTSSNGSSTDSTGSNAYTSIAQATKVHCKVYTAQALAQSLSLPSASYLPLVAILAGNDYYIPPIWKSSNGNNNPSARFEAIASSILKQLRKQRKPLDKSALPEFLRRVIDDIRDFAISESMISDITAKALETLPEYCVSSLQAPFLRGHNGTGRNGTETPVSISSFGIETDTSGSMNPLHALLLPSTLVLASNSSSEALAPLDTTQTKLRIYNAFEHGYFRNTLLQIVVYGTYTPSAVLEDPDKSSCIVSLGRPLRDWIYAILDSSVGIGRQTVPHLSKEASAIGESSEFGIHETSLSEEEGESSDVQDDEEEGTQDGILDDGSPAIRSVTEYVRRNAALAEEQVSVLPWSTLDPTPENTAPPLARSTLDRFHILLHTTSSFTDRLKDTASAHVQLLSIMLSLRHIAFTFEHTNQAWSQAERKAALLMAVIITKAYEGNTQAQEMIDKYSDPSIPVSNEYMQRAAQLTTTLLSVSLLIETLLLTPLLSTSPETLYQGSLFFDLLDTLDKNEDTEGEGELLAKVGIQAEQLETLVETMEEGLPRTLVSNRLDGKSQKKKKKKNKTAEQATSVIAESSENSRGNTSNKRNVPFNKFAMLAL